ncbi:MAG: LON peptidase substrate-binding domain-containing protein [Thioalkalivibrionaceae bacterium]
MTTPPDTTTSSSATGTTTVDTRPSPTRLPLFPLNTVVFPDGLLALRLFETRYVDMARRCLREDTGFVVVATALASPNDRSSSKQISEHERTEGDTRKGSDTDLDAQPADIPRRPNQPSADAGITTPYDRSLGFAAVGTRVRIIEADLRPDGLLGIECEGIERVSIERVARQRDGLWIGDVHDLPSAADCESDLDTLTALADHLAKRLAATGEGDLIRRGERLADASRTRSAHNLVGRLAELLPLDLVDRQTLLELNDPRERCTLLAALLLPDETRPS